MKRKISSLLLSLMCLQLAACGSETEGDVTDGAGTDTTTAAETEEPAPSGDFEGYTYRLLAQDSYTDIYFMEEATGEVIDDAVYDRNRLMEEAFNISIEVTSEAGNWDGRQNFIDAVRNTVLSGEDAWDVVAPDYYYGMELAIEGLFINLAEQSKLNFDEPWWVAGFNDNAIINGKLYGACGYYSTNSCSNMYLLYYNKTLHEEYNLPSLYDMVREGKWTHEAFYSMISTVSGDLNGNGEVDDNDLFGLIYQSHGARSFAPSYGVKYITRTAEGGLEITINSEKTYDVYDICYNMLNGQDFTHFINDDNLINTVFMEGNSLFMANSLSTSVNIRAMEDDFGMIPLPKYDENQPEYISYMRGADIFAIPLTTAEPSRAATLLEAFNYYSYRDVVPLYIETALKSKYARDNDSAEMIDLVMQQSYYDIGFIYSSVISYIADQFGNSICLDNNPNLSSTIAANMATYEANLADLLEAFED